MTERSSRMRLRSKKMPGGGESDLDADALPDRDAVLDFSSCGLWFGVIPGSIVVPNAVHFDVVIAGGALPGTNRSVIARFQSFFFDSFGREILIAFDNNGGVALGDNFSSPRCFGHLCAPPSQRDCFSPGYRWTDEHTH